MEIGANGCFVVPRGRTTTWCGISETTLVQSRSEALDLHRWLFLALADSALTTPLKARGHFPNEQATLKCVYMALMSLDPIGTGRKRWTMRWKPALNAFEIAFDGRLAAWRK